MTNQELFKKLIEQVNNNPQENPEFHKNFKFYCSELGNTIYVESKGANSFDNFEIRESGSGDLVINIEVDNLPLNQFPVVYRAIAYINNQIESLTWNS